MVLVREKCDELGGRRRDFTILRSVQRMQGLA